MALDPRTGLPKGLIPDTDPTGREGVGQFGAAPTGGGLAPTGGSSYASLLTLPGTRPDFWGILNSDPFLQQTQAGLGAQSIADRAQRDQMIRQALVGFGQVPDFAAAGARLGISGDEFAGIANDETRALAERNTQEGLSTVGRLERERNRAVQNIADVLAGRGALRSGAHGVALQDLQQDYKTAEYSAVEQLLGAISQYQRGLIEGERARAAQLLQAQQQAASRIDPNTAGGTEPVDVPFSHVDDAGVPVYKGPDGRTWTIGPDGKPVEYTPVVNPPPDPVDIGGGGTRERRAPGTSLVRAL